MNETNFESLNKPLETLLIEGKISKKTVFLKYNSATKKMTELDNLINQYKSKLNPSSFIFNTKSSLSFISEDKQ